jgi:hypothetical protein
MQAILKSIDTLSAEMESIMNLDNARTHQIMNELSLLEQKRIELSARLSSQDELDLRRKLSVLGNTITSDDVIYCTLWIVKEDPEPTEEYGETQNSPYSIDVYSGIHNDFGVIGMRYSVKIKTKNARVEQIIRDTFRQEGGRYYHNESTRTEWMTHHDYGDRIVVRRCTPPPSPIAYHYSYTYTYDSPPDLLRKNLACVLDNVSDTSALSVGSI